MKRKLIGQGRAGSVTVYLPKKWVDKQKLASGDEIFVDETNGNLLISSKEKKPEKKVMRTNLEEHDPSRLRTLIASAYRRGYDEITLTSKQTFSLVDINRVVDSLLGFVLVEQTENKVVIKNTISGEFENAASLINKLFFTAKTIAVMALEKKPSSQVEELKRSAIKLRDYCQRQIHLTTYKGDMSYEYHTLVFLLEKTAAEFFRYYTLKKNADPSLVDLFQEIHSAYLKKDIQVAIRLSKKIDNLRNKALLESDAMKLVILNRLFSLASRLVGFAV